ncbi:MAG: CaiB/BaiF CoA-transferase family protein [Halieaceae bacterium]|nr:CaiB/BaiF CoA-transferase family protein [Halieaceae bacterium]
MAGPLQGLKIVEMAGIGPGPFAGMLLSDLGADVIQVDRPGAAGMSASGDPNDVLRRGRRSIAVNLKNEAGVATVLKLLDAADVIFEGFRPGVMEKLGLGPDLCLARNPRLIYARMTGWGQEGPLARAAGHDINYIAITGALASIGRRDSGPVPPLNLLGDFGGGSMYLILGILAALYERNQSGRGQVIDAAISDGVISLMAAIQGFHGSGSWDGQQRQSNILDGAAHFYDTYQCADGEWVSIGSIEPQFHALLLEKLGMEPLDHSFADQFDKQKWAPLKARIRNIIASKTRAEWCRIMEGSDVCFAPVLSMSEAPEYPHNRARETFVDIEGCLQTAPAPRFSRTPGEIQGPPVVPGANTGEILEEIGLDEAAITSLKEAGAVA